MEIKVYRPNQIGGCITEITSKVGTKILIDIGSELPGIEREPINIGEITKGCEGVFVTHYHGDHVGEYRNVHSEVDIYMGKTAKQIFSVLQKRLSKSKKTGVNPEDIARVEKIKTFTHGEVIKIKDITITPIRTNHSAFDSYMFLISDGEKRVLHTGDFREQGIEGEHYFAHIKDYNGMLDAILIEGTMLSRTSEKDNTEEQLSIEAERLIRNSKFVFILCSSTNLDRISAFYRANKNVGDKLFITDDYQKSILDVVSENSKDFESLFDFSESIAFDKNVNFDSMLSKGFCMLLRCNRFSEKFIRSKKFQNDRLFIYSMWKGYLEGAARNENLAKLVPDDYVYLHTSGHATEETICKVCNSLNVPIILPIHSDCIERFQALRSEGKINGDVQRLESGISIKL